MNDKSGRFTIEQPLDCTPETAFDLWTTPEAMRKWFAAEPGWSAEIRGFQLRTGVEFTVLLSDGQMSVPHFAEFLALDRPRGLVMTWRSEFTSDYPSRVTLEFLPARGGTLLRLTHEELPAGKATDDHREGWTLMLHRIAELAIGEKR